MQDTLSYVREQLTDLITRLENPGYAEKANPEVTLARRHLEDARMRLGVAQVYQLNQNPWETK